MLKRKKNSDEFTGTAVSESSKSTNKEYRSRTLRRGTYSVGLSILVLALIIVINLIVSALPSNVTNKDLSPTLLYTIGDTSRSYLESLDEDVEIIVVAESGTVDERITNFLNSYASLSSHVSVSETDPILHPDVLTAYDIDDDTIVVRCDATGRYMAVSFDEIIVKELNSYYYYYYGTEYYEEVEFDGEGQLTSAINFVTSTDNYMMYMLTGHGESGIADALSKMISKANLDVDVLDLMETSEIPEDCNLLMINGATSDISEFESELLLDYLHDGGKMIVTLASPITPLPNLEAVLNDYGIAAEYGLVGDMTRYLAAMGSPFYFYPVVEDNDLLTSVDSNSLLLVSNATALSTIDTIRSSVKFSDLLVSSEDALLYVPAENENEEGTYEEGEYLLGVKAEEEVNGRTAELIVFGSSDMVSPYMIDSFSSSISNADMMLDCIKDLIPEMESITIASKSLEVTFNTVTYPMTIGIIFIAVIPAILLLTGFVIWFRRRRK